LPILVDKWLQIVFIKRLQFAYITLRKIIMFSFNNLLKDWTSSGENHLFSFSEISIWEHTWIVIHRRSCLNNTNRLKKWWYFSHCSLSNWLKIFLKVWCWRVWGRLGVIGTSWAIHKWFIICIWRVIYWLIWLSLPWKLRLCGCLLNSLRRIRVKIFKV
jgi:hypothetical protein